MSADKYIIDALNNVLLFSQSRLKSLKTEGALLTCPISVSVNHPLGIELRATEPLKLKLDRTRVQVEAAYLFNEMKRRHLTSYPIQKGKLIIFSDIASDKVEEIVNEPASFVPWLNSRAPKGMKVELLGGDISVLPATKNEQTVGIAIEAEEDCILTLHFEEPTEIG